MLVVDTSAFVSLAVGDVLGVFVDDFQVVTTEAVLEELEATATDDDRHGDAASRVLDCVDEFETVACSGEPFVTSRIDTGEASCVAAVREVGAAFLVTDDFRALPELQEVVDADVALSLLVLRALVDRGALAEAEATAAFDCIAAGRDWLEAPIYRYASQLFD